MKLYQIAASLALPTLLLAVPSGVFAQAPAKTLTITEVEPLVLDHLDAQNPTALYYLVETHYPKAWMDKVESSFQITVDGKPAAFDGIGGGFSDDANRSFRFYAGTAGKRLVQVSLTVEGKQVKASREFTVKAPPLVRLLDHVADECVFENAPLRFLVFDATNPVIKLNGKAIVAEAKPSVEFPGITILTVPPSLLPGINQVEIVATGSAGQPVTQKSTLLFAAENTVKVGSKLNVVWGYMGSRSGPFFQLGSDQQVLVPAGSKQLESRIEVESGKSNDAAPKFPWISAGGVNVYSFTAQKPGKGKLSYEEQSHWTLPSEVKKTVEITVVP